MPSSYINRVSFSDSELRFAREPRHYHRLTAIVRLPPQVVNIKNYHSGVGSQCLQLLKL